MPPAVYGACGIKNTINNLLKTYVSIDIVTMKSKVATKHILSFDKKILWTRF